MMPQLAIRHIEHSPVLDLRPIGVLRQKNKLGLGIDKIFDQPWAGDAIDFNFLPSDPFHATQVGEISVVQSIESISL